MIPSSAKIANVYGLRLRRRIHGGAAPPPRFPLPQNTGATYSQSFLIRLALWWQRLARP